MAQLAGQIGDRGEDLVHAIGTRLFANDHSHVLNQGRVP
jgi:hypothetical protein